MASRAGRRARPHNWLLPVWFSTTARGRWLTCSTEVCLLLHDDRFKDWSERSGHFRQTLPSPQGCSFPQTTLRRSLETSTLSREVFSIYFVTLLLLMVQNLLINGWINGHWAELWIFSWYNSDWWSTVFNYILSKDFQQLLVRAISNLFLFFSFILLQMVCFWKECVFNVYYKSLSFCNGYSAHIHTHTQSRICQETNAGKRCCQ